MDRYMDIQTARPSHNLPFIFSKVIKVGLQRDPFMTLNKVYFIMLEYGCKHEPG
jgi:hypothetical protein